MEKVSKDMLELLLEFQKFLLNQKSRRRKTPDSLYPVRIGNVF